MARYNEAANRTASISDEIEMKTVDGNKSLARINAAISFQDTRPENERTEVAYRLVYDIIGNKIARTCVMIDPKTSLHAAAEASMPTEVSTSGLSAEKTRDITQSTKIPEIENISEASSNSDSDTPLIAKKRKSRRWESPQRSAKKTQRNPTKPAPRKTSQMQRSQKKTTATDPKRSNHELQHEIQPSRRMQPPSPGSCGRVASSAAVSQEAGPSPVLFRSPQQPDAEDKPRTPGRSLKAAKGDKIVS